MLAFGLCIFLPFIFSFLFVSTQIGYSEKDQIATLVFKVTLAMGLVLGLTSCSFFLWLFFVGSPGMDFQLIELVLFGSLSIFLLLRSKVKKPMANPFEIFRKVRLSSLSTLIFLCVLVALVTRLTRFVFTSLNSPFGEIDALITWNLRARFLFFGLDNWKEYFTEKLATSAQPDYPLLLPSSIARLWTYFGSDPQVVPMGIALIFTFSIVGIAIASITILRGTTQGLLAALVLLGTPFLLEHGATQYADIPLAYFFLATLAMFCIYDSFDSSRKGVVILAGILAGFAAWTKNEGVLFLLVILLVRFLVIVSNRGLRDYFEETKYFFQGLTPILLIILLFKTQVAPSATLFISQGIGEILLKLQTPANYMEVGWALTKHSLRFGHPGFPLLIIYGLLLGFRKFKNHLFPFLTPILVLLVMLTGYAFIIITTPFLSITYQLATSLDRLWIQLWPCMVLLFFLIIRTPEEVLNGNISFSHIQNTSSADEIKRVSL